MMEKLPIDESSYLQEHYDNLNLGSDDESSFYPVDERIIKLLKTQQLTDHELVDYQSVLKTSAEQNQFLAWAGTYHIPGKEFSHQIGKCYLDLYRQMYLNAPSTAPVRESASASSNISSSEASKIAEAKHGQALFQADPNVKSNSNNAPKPIDQGQTLLKLALTPLKKARQDMPIKFSVLPFKYRYSRNDLKPAYQQMNIETMSPKAKQAVSYEAYRTQSSFKEWLETYPILIDVNKHVIPQFELAFYLVYSKQSRPNNSSKQPRQNVTSKQTSQNNSSKQSRQNITSKSTRQVPRQNLGSKIASNNSLNPMRQNTSEKAREKVRQSVKSTTNQSVVKKAVKTDSTNVSRQTTPKARQVVNPKPVGQHQANQSKKVDPRGVSNRGHVDESALNSNPFSDMKDEATPKSVKKSNAAVKSSSNNDLDDFDFGRSKELNKKFSHHTTRNYDNNNLMKPTDQEVRPKADEVIRQTSNETIGRDNQTDIDQTKQTKRFDYRLDNELFEDIPENLMNETYGVVKWNHILKNAQTRRLTFSSNLLSIIRRILYENLIPDKFVKTLLERDGEVNSTNASIVSDVDCVETYFMYTAVQNQLYKVSTWRQWCIAKAMSKMMLKTKAGYTIKSVYADRLKNYTSIVTLINNDGSDNYKQYGEKLPDSVRFFFYLSQKTPYVNLNNSDNLSSRRQLTEIRNSVDVLKYISVVLLESNQNNVNLKEVVASDEFHRKFNELLDLTNEIVKPIKTRNQTNLVRYQNRQHND